MSGRERTTYLVTGAHGRIRHTGPFFMRWGAAACAAWGTDGKAPAPRGEKNEFPFLMGAKSGLPVPRQVLACRVNNAHPLFAKNVDPTAASVLLDTDWSSRRGHS